MARSRAARRITWLALGAAVICGVAAAGSYAQLRSTSTVSSTLSVKSSTLTPTDDARIDSSAPTSNFGRSTRLGFDGDPVTRSYLRFDLSGVQGTVTKAVLEVTPTSSHPTGFTVHGVAAGDWTQSGITWSNAPAMDSASAATSGPLTAGTPVDVDVTSLVSAGGVSSIALADAGSARAASLASSEASDYAGPKLLLTVNAPTVLPPLAFPIRAAFYYPWFTETWGNPIHTNYHPTLGEYSSDDPSTVDAHIQALDYANVNVGIASWWGPGKHSESTRIPELMNETEALGSTLRWALYYEPEGYSNPSADQIASDLAYIKANYTSNPHYAKVNGKPVIFVYGDDTDRCDMATRWAQANANEGFYVSLKVFPGFRTCADQPDTWHQYSPAVATVDQKGYSYSVSPGFWKWDETSPRLARDPGAWTQNVQSMVASGEPWQLVTTFNEWGEGTAVESASEWASPSGYGTYLDALHDTPSGSGGGSTAADPVVAAAGDIACAPSSGSFNGGLGTKSACREQWTSDLLMNTENLGGVMPLGDVQYECGNQADFAASYDPTWGRLKSITHWVTGNHEYGQPCGRNDNSYASSYFNVSNPTDWYSWDVGKWHMIALNSECNYGTGAGKVGGCNAGSPQETWLKQDLAAHPNTCTLAYWHEPRFSSGEHGDAQQMATIWNDLVAAHVDVVLSGHNHDYERFDPIGATPQGTDLYQSPNLDPNGIREFVVGTGGKNHYGFGTQPALTGEIVRDSSTYGVLELTLHDSSYDWKFVNDPGSGSFTDSGSGACH